MEKTGLVPSGVFLPIMYIDTWHKHTPEPKVCGHLTIPPIHGSSPKWFFTTMLDAHNCIGYLSGIALLFSFNGTNKPRTYMFQHDSDPDVHKDCQGWCGRCQMAYTDPSDSWAWLTGVEPAFRAHLPQTSIYDAFCLCFSAQHGYYLRFL